MANGPVVSIVMLLEHPRVLVLDEVERAAECAFEVLFNRGDHRIIPIPDKPCFAVQLPDMTLGVIFDDRPYFKNKAEAMDSTSEFAVKQAIQDHCGWISVDLMGDPSQQDTDAAYVAIGQLTAELADPDPLALVSTPTGKIVDYDRCFLKLLRTGNAQEVFKLGSPDRIIGTKPDDPELAAAADEARRRFPEFLAAFAKRQKGQGFGIKKAFNEAGKVEHMWIEPSEFDGTLIRGRLANTPRSILTLSLGDPVTATPDEIEDWIYTDNGRTFGGFQVAILQNRDRKR
ncbi:MAG TPA: DUF2314 domain-containing protein [Phycisphaerae bacterium]|nr:DUF2314 domain-containing protein [Phycisphaerae bacterium]